MDVVLVVEADPDVRQMLSHCLPAFGFAVVAAADGREAVHRLRGYLAKLAAAVIDAGSDLNGLEAVRVVQAGAPRVPVILTGEVSPSRAAAVGAVGVLRKPYRLGALARELRDAPPDPAAVVAARP